MALEGYKVRRRDMKDLKIFTSNVEDKAKEQIDLLQY